MATAVALLAAHDVTVQGTVAAIESTRIQVKTGLEARDESPAWYPIDAATIIRRGRKTVTLADARIQPDERVVLLIDHPDKGALKTKEIRLAAR